MTPVTPPAQTPPVLTPRLYDILKKLSLVYLPALGTLYFTLAQILGLPYAEQVIGTIAAVNVFFGAIVNQSAKNYSNSDAKFDGTIVTAVKPDGGKVFTLQFSDDEIDLDKKDEVTFKVVPEEKAAA